MTISTTTNKVTYNGNDSTVAFATTYRFLEDGDLNVYIDDTLQTVTTDYSVTGAGLDAGGTVTFLTAPATGEVVTIKNNPPRTQETDYVENDPFPAESHEEALDKLTLITQSLGEDSDRTLKFAIDSSSTATVPEPEADKVLGWDVTGTDLENIDIASMGAITIPVPITQGGTGATDAPTALANLGAEPEDAAILKADKPDELEVGYTETMYTYTGGTIDVEDGNTATMATATNAVIGDITGTGKVTLLITGTDAVTYNTAYVGKVAGSYDESYGSGICQVILDKDGNKWLIFVTPEA